MRADTADAPELNDRGHGASFTYDAFLSYNHPHPAVVGCEDGAICRQTTHRPHRRGAECGIQPRRRPHCLGK
jgi:hypothetical protein